MEAVAVLSNERSQQYQLETDELSRRSMVSRTLIAAGLTGLLLTGCGSQGGGSTETIYAAGAVAESPAPAETPAPAPILTTPPEAPQPPAEAPAPPPAPAPTPPAISRVVVGSGSTGPQMVEDLTMLKEGNCLPAGYTVVNKIPTSTISMEQRAIRRAQITQGKQPDGKIGFISRSAFSKLTLAGKDICTSPVERIQAGSVPTCGPLSPEYGGFIPCPKPEPKPVPKLLPQVPDLLPADPKQKQPTCGPLSPENGGFTPCGKN